MSSNPNTSEINLIEDQELQRLMNEKDKLEKELLVSKLKENKATNKNSNTNTNSNINIQNFKENQINSKLNINQEDKSLLTTTLKRNSRIEFLKKTTEKQIELFRLKIKDEEKLFNITQLTDEEIRVNEVNKKILGIIDSNFTQKNNSNGIENKMKKDYEYESYRLPDSYDNNFEDNKNVDIQKKYKVLFDKEKSK